MSKQSSSQQLSETAPEQPKRSATPEPSVSEPPKKQSLSFVTPRGGHSLPSLYSPFFGPIPLRHSTPMKYSPQGQAAAMSNIPMDSTGDMYAPMLDFYKDQIAQLEALQEESAKQNVAEETIVTATLYEDSEYSFGDYDLNAEEYKNLPKTKFLRVCMVKLSFYMQKMIETYNLTYELVSEIKAEEAHKQAVAAEEGQGVVEEMPSADRDTTQEQPQEPTSRRFPLSLFSRVRYMNEKLKKETMPDYREVKVSFQL